MTLRTFVEKICADPELGRVNPATLANWLYRAHYTVRPVGTLPTHGFRWDESTEAFHTALRNANRSPNVWVPAVYQANGNGGIGVVNDLKIRVEQNTMRHRDGTTEIAMPTHAQTEDGWFRFDTHGFCAAAVSPRCRVYCNVAPRDALALLRTVSEQSQTFSAPVRIKIAADPDQFLSRWDNCIVYCSSVDKGALLAGLTTCTTFVPYVAPLTQMIAPGIGYAEDAVGSADSFGMYRCRMIAEGLRLCESFAEVDHVYEAVCSYWRKQGFWPDEPWKSF